jgi:hypothetical protein
MQKLLINEEYLIELPPGFPLPKLRRVRQQGYSSGIFEIIKDRVRVEMIDEESLLDPERKEDATLLLIAEREKLEKSVDLRDKAEAQVKRLQFLLDNQAALVAQGFTVEHIKRTVNNLGYWCLSIDNVSKHMREELAKDEVAALAKKKAEEVAALEEILPAE